MTLTASPRWKEEMVITDEEGNAFIFECGWGVSPGVAYIPSVAIWARSVPPWLRARRDDVVAVIQGTGHVVKDDEHAPFCGE